MRFMYKGFLVEYDVESCKVVRGAVTPISEEACIAMANAPGISRETWGSFDIQELEPVFTLRMRGAIDDVCTQPATN